MLSAVVDSCASVDLSLHFTSLHFTSLGRVVCGWGAREDETMEDKTGARQEQDKTMEHAAGRGTWGATGQHVRLVLVLGLGLDLSLALPSTYDLVLHY